MLKTVHFLLLKSKCSVTPSLSLHILQIIRAHRLEREADYAAQRELEWEQALAEEAQRHRPVPAHLRPYCSCITLIAFLFWQDCRSCQWLLQVAQNLQLFQSAGHFTDIMPTQHKHQQKPHQHRQCCKRPATQSGSWHCAGS
jgi:hypothetical protein